MNRKVHSRPSALPQIQTLTLSPEEEQEFDYDVCCCIEEIESILSKNATEKQKKLGEVSLKILRNPRETFIKKKQIMRQWFGDYRKKFDSKKKQMISNLNCSKASFKECDASVKSIFFRKHEVKHIVFDKNSAQGNNIGENSVPENNNSHDKAHFSFQPSDNSFKFGF